MKDIYKGLVRCYNGQLRAVLATIVKADGSSYRREGARCLIHETGEIDGMLSGGCVESDLLEHSRDVLTTNTPKIIKYDFRWENDLLWGLGVGCNGVITVWLEPFDPINHREKASKLLSEIQNRLTCDTPYFYLSVIESSNHAQLQPGIQWNEEYGQSEWLTLNNPQKPCLVETMVNGCEALVYVEPIQPLPWLFIIGSGPDAALLAKQASNLPWRVKVIDHRETYLSTYFPDIDKALIRKSDYESVPIPPGSYAVIMTHNLESDQAALSYLLKADLNYIGLLGSRQRFAKLTELIGQETNLTASQLQEKIHSPVGLDIGAESPEEITISILSELTAFKNGRTGGSLCHRKIKAF
ncbi:XdhC family protein [Neobacillus sp. Marseille-QA0830]